LASLSIIIPIIILGNILTDKLLQPQIWIDSLDNIQVSEQIESYFSQTLFSIYISGSSISVGQISSTANWDNIAKTIIPSDWVEYNLKLIVQAVPEWLSSSDTFPPNIIIDLTSIKNNLRSPQSAVAVLPLFENIPVCQGNVGKIVFMSGSLVDCIPAGWDLLHISETALNIIADGLPDQASIISMAETRNLNNQMLQTIYQMKQLYRIWEAALSFGLRIMIVLFCLYLLLQAKSMVFLIRKIPVPLYLAGVMLLILFTGGFILIKWGINVMMPLFGSKLNLDAQSILIDFIRSFGSQIQIKWLLWGFGMLMTGAAIQALAALLYKYIQKYKMIIKNQPKQYIRIKKQF
jgi:hypothetical protein